MINEANGNAMCAIKLALPSALILNQWLICCLLLCMPP